MGCQVNLGKVPSSRVRSTRLVRYCSFRCPLELKRARYNLNRLCNRPIFFSTYKKMISFLNRAVKPALGRSELKVSILARAFYRLVANWFTTNISKSS